MYPAQALLDGLYTVDDLPDTLVVIGSAGTPYSCLVTKTNGSSPYYSGTCEGEQSRIIINDDNAWEFQTLSPEDGWLEPQDRSPNACLIFDPNLAGNAYIEDQFADTYTVNADLEFPWEEQGNPITIPVNGSFSLERVSLCQWVSSGFPTNAPFFVLNYVNLPPSENPMLEEGPQWALSVYFLEYDPGLFASTVQFKNEPQNSPVGFYGTGIYGTASIS
jgi:hypothetical protein